MDKVKIKGLIQSPRTFGVEIEMGAKRYRDIDKLRSFVDKLGRGWRFEDDGSIRNEIENPIELVTPILRGEDGERKLVAVCEKLKEYGFNADHVSCGMHVHLGAEEFKERRNLIVMGREELTQFLSSERNKKSIENILYLDRVATRRYFNMKPDGKLLTMRYRKFAMGLLTGAFWGLDLKGGQLVDTNLLFNFGKEKDVPVRCLVPVARSEWKEIEARHAERLTTAQRICNTQLRPPKGTPERVVWEQAYKEQSVAIKACDELRMKEYDVAVRGKVELGDGRYVVEAVTTEHTEKLLTLFLFYALYDRVFLGMLPRSRRKGNSYCMPISETYNVEEILNCKSQEDFEKLWYRERDKNSLPRHKGEHYNDSRYHDINFHSLFNRHGTVEIRSHGSTTNHNRILLWTALHQAVLDGVACGRVTLERLRGTARSNLSMLEMARDMVSILELPHYLRKYVARLLSYYSDINI